VDGGPEVQPGGADEDGDGRQRAGAQHPGYGKGGQVILQIVQEGIRRGLRLSFEDNGPGIPDVELALRDGYTSGGGMGLGLGGARGS
jgi:anti-sigma regulatory factor (Ser/Thr protein kinase)